MSTALRDIEGRAKDIVDGIEDWKLILEDPDESHAHRAVATGEVKALRRQYRELQKEYNRAEAGPESQPS